MKRLSVGPILGSRTHSSSGYSQMFLLRGSTSGSEKIYIQVTSADGSYHRAASGQGPAGRDHTRLFRFDDLPPNTSFNCLSGVVPVGESTVALKNKDLTGGTESTFRTGDPDTNNTSFSFGSCRHGDARKSNGVHLDDLCFNVMLSKSADDDFVVMCGDQIYGDMGTGGGDIPLSARKLVLTHYLTHYRRYFARPKIAAIMASRPTYMILDDHEVKDNWSRGAFDRRERKFRNIRNLREGLMAYDFYQASHSPAQGGPRYYYEFTHGRCDFFVMDTRTERDVVPGRLVHPNQLEAVKRFLRRGRDRIKFLVTASPMFPDSSHRSISIDVDPRDRWEGYPRERGVILEAMRSAIRQGDNKNFIVLSGDVHCSFLYRLNHTSDSSFRIHEIVSSALHWKLPGLRDRHFAPTTPLRGNETFVPERLPAGRDGRAITSDNFCRVEVKNKIVEATFFNRRGRALRTSRISLL